MGNDSIAFTGIQPKPPSSPDLAYLFKHSADYGSLWGLEIPKQKKKKGRMRKRGKIRLFPDE